MHNQTDSTIRLRKFVRQPENYAERYGAFELTPRDLDVIELVLRYRHLSADHIRSLTEGSKQQITRRLSGLFHHGYLQRYVPLERMRYDLNGGSPVMAYGLDTKGWRTLLQSGRVVDDESEAHDATWRKEYTRRMSWFLEHHLGISNFRCVLELALRQPARNGLALLEWDQSARTRGKVVLRDKSVLRVNPDAFFSIQSQTGVRNYYLEFDAGSEEQRRIEAKFRAYWWWLQSLAYHETHHDSERVAVLFVTTGHRRMENMIGTLSRMAKPNNPTQGGKGWFRFCLETDYQLGSPSSIFAPLWRTVGRSQEPLPLL